MKNIEVQKVLVYMVLLLSFVTYGYAYSPPQLILQKRISYVEQNGLENANLKGDMLLRLGELVQYAFDPKMILSWEKIGLEKYVLTGVLHDDFAGEAVEMKILFSDRENQDYILMDRMIWNGEEVDNGTKLVIFKRFIMGAILAKRKALTGSYKKEHDMSHITKYWEGR